MKDLTWALVTLHLSREAHHRVMREKSYWLDCIAGGYTPEEAAARFNIDLKVIEMVVAYDLANRRGKR